MSTPSSSDDVPESGLPRRTFLKSAGTLTIGFSLLPGCQLTQDEADAAEASDPAGRSDLPPSLAQHPRIDAWLRVLGDGRLRVYTGKLELGQGIRIAIAQVAAEELHTSPDRLEVHLAETGVTPNERYTSASVSIEHSAMSVRHASATARRILKERAAQQFGVESEGVKIDDGTLTAGSQSATFAEVLGDEQITETVTEPADLRPTDEREWVGTPVERTDIDRMVRGEEVYVQDLRFDDMVHARVVRPPGYDASLREYDEDAVREAVGDGLQIVQNGSFLAVVAEGEHQALRAQQVLQSNAEWSEPRALPADTPLEEHLRALPAETETVVDEGSAGEGETISASYFRPYVMHGSLGPSCAVGHYDGDRLRIWTHSQGVYPLRDTLTALVGLPPEKIEVKGVPGSGCYGHNGADDVAADVALLAMEVPNRHVRLQWEREDEHGWEPYGSAMIMDVEATLGDDGTIQDWQFDVHSDSHSTRPGGDPGNLLAGRYIEDAHALTSRGYLAGGYRNAVPYYELPTRSISAHFFDGPLRVSALRGLGAHANVFAIESMMGELADRAGTDPVVFRKQHLEDPRAGAVLDAVAEQAQDTSVGATEGLGYGFARYKNRASYCAVAARVRAEADGDLTVTHLWGAIDSGEVINPDGLRNQVEGGMIQSMSWMLNEEVQFDDTRITSREWGSYPILQFEDVPVVEATVLDRPDEPPLGAGEAAQGPATGAVANAIARATDERVQSLPVRSS
ncbi:aldehyde dehydrogenase [Salinibacter sp. 10B]|uniref:xanthine dehydrogenase family protein molybdopterin-binding subunit n=1 Tax=Salinibacter sp. 10B TaxID=1923971 RepID=UPI000CF5287A|nr:molybdopterin cofactor-binding domain-containing protein [Salinibacter sp. 10B]PQJ26966.1 aldehyde dehydrogenase [Salinibacter sp. 10B]